MHFGWRGCFDALPRSVAVLYFVRTLAVKIQFYLYVYGV